MEKISNFFKKKNIYFACKFYHLQMLHFQEELERRVST